METCSAIATLQYVILALCCLTAVLIPIALIVSKEPDYRRYDHD